jgi:hypothetical protein
VELYLHSPVCLDDVFRNNCTFHTSCPDVPFVLFLLYARHVAVLRAEHTCGGQLVPPHTLTPTACAVTVIFSAHLRLVLAVTPSGLTAPDRGSPQLGLAYSRQKDEANRASEQLKDA